MVDQIGQVLSVSLSKGTGRDASQVPRLLKDIERPIDSFTEDRGYDVGSVYRSVLKHSPGATIVVPQERMQSVRQQGKTSGFSEITTSIRYGPLVCTTGEVSPVTTGRAL